MTKVTLIRCFDVDTTPYAAISGPDRTLDDFGGEVPSVGDVFAEKLLGADRNTLEVVGRYFDPPAWEPQSGEQAKQLVRLLVRRRDPRRDEIDILGF